MRPSLNIPYSAQYLTITREGHESPPPTFGAPTLVWHLAISPHWPDESQSGDEPLHELHRRLALDYEHTRSQFFGGINRLLRALHGRPSAPPSAPNMFDANAVPPPWPKPRKQLGEPFLVTSPTNIRFTLWWQDDDARPAAGVPTQDALRVLVHVAAHRDFVTISFYLDAGKPWDAQPVTRGQPVVGRRRRQVFDAVEYIQNAAEERLGGPDDARNVDREVLPETGVDTSLAAGLMGSSRYLFSSLWDEFCAAYGITDLAALIGHDASGRPLAGAGRVFANFRGLVISTPGLDGKAEAYPGASGAQPFARFAGNGGIAAGCAKAPTQPNEANAVVKAFWPFIRRITPYADQREFVACGVMNWRALYVTALGSPRAFDWDEEGSGCESQIPGQYLPEQLIDATGKYDSLSGPQNEGPLRYLVLTKGEPHRRQIGRIVERLNTMGTMRLVALRDWTIIRDASTHIQLRGLELDTIMKKWSEKSTAIRSKYEERWWRPFFKTRRRDKRDELLQKLATVVERDLIYLSAALDETGLKAVHGLHFRINRSRYYVQEFESLLATLSIGNIDTWVAYDQFVTRGLKPAFDFIDGVGTRLLGLRTRLQSVLEGIETSALVIQTSATRSNTAQLRRLANRFRLQNVLIVGIGALLSYTPDSQTWVNLLSELQILMITVWELVVTTLNKL